ncbi:hypothetical protein SK803_34310 [Lentzea sp. BCCO 10_0856]|uniref:Guanylate cyclase domain-containing protein n=1 Tax=Lentzea miocenica TaxID=3095431 RepID=A0ABU4TAV4_9PSEU|nr:hypothetical protein [Lentzea sp. BCCO 10_0856]MDX8035311.1 hypothetical protein [Lentzea sp. BCCO 10_0856]
MPDHDEPIDLPPYRAVLVFDTKDFGSNTDPNQELLAGMIPDVVALAFERIGLIEVWRGALFPHNTGDGFGIGFATRHLPAVVSDLFDALQDVLAERDARLRERRPSARLRMRASLNVGPVREGDTGGDSAVVGGTVITTHRLLDAAPVRDVLTLSDPEETFLSVVLSQRVFEDVVASGYATLHPSRVVQRTVEIKEFAGTVYLYVPKLSGRLLEHGIGEEQPMAAVAEAEQDRFSRALPVTNVMTGTHVGPSIQIGHLKGGLHNKM